MHSMFFYSQLFNCDSLNGNYEIMSWSYGRDGSSPRPRRLEERRTAINDTNTKAHISPFNVEHRIASLQTAVALSTFHSITLDMAMTCNKDQARASANKAQTDFHLFPQLLTEVSLKYSAYLSISLQAASNISKSTKVHPTAKNWIRVTDRQAV